MLRLWEWLRKSVSRNSMAVSFAEANESEMALELLKDSGMESSLECVIDESKDLWLLVRGVGAEFTSECIEYAVDMAKRMEWGVMALSCADLGCGSIWNKKDRALACERFKSDSESKVLGFKSLCMDAGLNFRHELRFMNPKNAVEDVVKSESISFIVAEDIDNRNEKTAKEKDLRGSLYVYSLRT
jgi:hypothetical protein